MSLFQTLIDVISENGVLDNCSSDGVIILMLLSLIGICTKNVAIGDFAYGKRLCQCALIVGYFEK